MRTTHIAAVLATCLVWILTGTAVSLAASDKERVNDFYTKLVKALRSSEPSALDLAKMIKRDRAAAQRCLSKIEPRCSAPGKEGEAFRFVRDNLEAMLMITGNRLNCSNPALEKLVKIGNGQTEDDDKLFYLENITRLCPNAVKAHTLSADLYLKRRQAGMAVQAYKRALALKDDGDSRKLLEKAEDLLGQYQEGKPITVAQARKLFQQKTMAPVAGVFGRKVQVRGAIQRQILFDEWKYDIKKEFLPELNALGQVLKDEFRDNDRIGLVIEGHADRRGPEEKLYKLSRDRAQSIKNHLAQQFGIDPSRLVIKGYGPSRPFSPRDDSVGWALNRRVEFKKVDQVVILR
jgi:outer membrane protein OmpA-like peptidoglycan-associated protein